MIRFHRDTLQPKPPAPKQAALAVRKGGVSESPAQPNGQPASTPSTGNNANG